MARKSRYTVTLKGCGKTVAQGTAWKCAAKMGMSVHAFRSLYRGGKQKRYEILCMEETENGY